MVATRPNEAVEKEEEGVVVTICTQTGQRATEYCPQTVDTLFGPDEQVPGYCTKPRAPGAGSATASGGSSAGGQPREGRTVTVTICEDSGKLATPFCPRSREIEVPADAAPTSKCNLHGPSADTSTSASPPSEEVGEKPEEQTSTGAGTTGRAVSGEEGQR